MSNETKTVETCRVALLAFLTEETGCNVLPDLTAEAKRVLALYENQPSAFRTEDFDEAVATVGEDIMANRDIEPFLEPVTIT